jgi:hypothetical protein
MSSESSEGTEKVQALLIFSLAEEWKQVLLIHGCTFGVLEEYGETIQFPEGTTRTLLYSREGRPTNRYRIQLPDGLELREVLDDEGNGKSWLTLVLSQEPMQDVRGTSDVLQGKTIPGKGRDAQKKHEARALIKKAEARAGLITVLTRRLESSDDLLARIVAAELRDDPHWQAFTRGVTWYDRRRRKIARRRR